MQRNSVGGGNGRGQRDGEDIKERGRERERNFNEVIREE